MPAASFICLPANHNNITSSYNIVKFNLMYKMQQFVDPPSIVCCFVNRLLSFCLWHFLFGFSFVNISIILCSKTCLNRIIFSCKLINFVNTKVFFGQIIVILFRVFCCVLKHYRKVEEHVYGGPSPRLPVTQCIMLKRYLKTMSNFVLFAVEVDMALKKIFKFKIKKTKKHSA